MYQIRWDPSPVSGSVFLWNIEYDDYRESAGLAIAGVALDVARLKRPGLDAALSKSCRRTYRG